MIFEIYIFCFFVDVLYVKKYIFHIWVSPIFFFFFFFTYLFKEKKSEKTILNTNLHFMKHDSQSIELSFKTIQLSKLVIKLESKTYFITNLVLYSQYIYI
jgi:hypothetical protein